LPGHVELLISQHLQVLLLKAALHPFISQPVLIPAVAPAQVQDPALGLVETHEVCTWVHFLSLPSCLWMVTSEGLSFVSKAPVCTGLASFTVDMGENKLHDIIFLFIYLFSQKLLTDRRKYKTKWLVDIFSGRKLLFPQG